MQHLLGIVFLSQADVLLDHPHTCRLLGSVRHAPRVLGPPTVVVRNARDVVTRFWTGKDVFSSLLPETLFVEPGGAGLQWGEWDDDELPVVVRRGRLLSGVLRKAHVGTGAGGIIDTMCRDHDGVVYAIHGRPQRMTHEFVPEDITSASTT